MYSIVRGVVPEVNSAILALMAARSAGIFAVGFFFQEGRGMPALSSKGASPYSLFGSATSLQWKNVDAHPLTESTIRTCGYQSMSRRQLKLMEPAINGFF